MPPIDISWHRYTGNNQPEDFVLNDDATHVEAIVNAYILDKIQFYRENENTDGRLWTDFREDFQGWTSSLFKCSSRNVRKILKDHLRKNGVFVSQTLPIYEGLHRTLTEASQHQWTVDEIAVAKREGNFNSFVYNRAITPSPLQRRGRSSRPQSMRPQNSQPVNPDQNTSNITSNTTTKNPEDNGAGSNQAGGQPFHPDQGPTPKRSTPSNSSESQDDYNKILDQITTKKTQQKNNSSALLDQYGDPQDFNTAKQLADLKKGFLDSEKYEGKLFDILDFKIRIFLDNCRKVGLPASELSNAYSIMLKGKASEFYHNYISGKGYDIDKMVKLTREHFETETNRQEYLTLWRRYTLRFVMGEEGSGKSKLECLEILFDKLVKIQQGLSMVYQEEHSLRDQIINACKGVPDCKLALQKPADTFEGLCADLRTAIYNEEACQEASQFMTSIKPVEQNHGSEKVTDHTLDYGSCDRCAHIQDSDINMFDRVYSRTGSGRGRSSSRGSARGSFRGGFKSNQSYRQKKCYVCQKPGCWSTRHSAQERRDAAARWQATATRTGRDSSQKAFQNFLVQVEGMECWPEEEVDELEALMVEIEMEEEGEGLEMMMTEYGEVNGVDAVALLADYSTRHAATLQNPFDPTFYWNPRAIPTDIFTFEDRYSSTEFQGIMPDSGASGVSTCGEPQFKALQGIIPAIQLDTVCFDRQAIRFGKGSTRSIGSAVVPTPLGSVTVQVVGENTPFLLCLQDMDRLKVKLDNLKNVLIQGNKRFPVTRKWGHPWLLLKPQPRAQEANIVWSNLTEAELRRVHRRFGHPNVRKLQKILTKSGHDFERRAIERITRYCHQCQMHEKSPGRFKFSLKKDFSFNAEVSVDIVQIDGRNVVHVVDTATGFQAARFVSKITAKEVWEAIRLCWIDVYQGPPDQIVHDAGKQFASAEFRQEAKAIGTLVKEVPVEAHQSVGKIERYHATLRRSYEVIRTEFPGASRESVLQMAVKAVNDTAGPNGLVPTLLVFGAFPRLAEESPPSPSIFKRAAAIRKATKEIKKLYAKRMVSDAISMRNGPVTLPTLNLPLQSKVRVWRERKGWKGPYTLISTEGETCTIEMPRGPRRFRSTVVRPYLEEEAEAIPELLLPDDNSESEDESSECEDDSGLPENEKPLSERELRPQSLKNQEEPESTDQSQAQPQPEDDETIVVQPPAALFPAVKKRPGRPRTSANLQEPDDAELYMLFTEKPANREGLLVYMTEKEKNDFELALKLRREGKITTPGSPFKLSDDAEIDGLLAIGVFDFEMFDPEKHGDMRIFNARMVREVKGKGTNSPYEKSRLVIQGHSDNDKKVILTQSPTIQRASQRMIVAISPTLRLRNILLWIRDITQAYIQSQSYLQRTIYCYLPKELENRYPQGTIMRLLKPLYGLAEAGLHWFVTYFKHHLEKLLMETSTYDPCLLVTSSEEQFAVVGMQTDDTLILADEKWSALEQLELEKAGFKAKPKTQLSPENPLIFNGCILSQEGNNMVIRQKEQGKKLHEVKVGAEDMLQKYVEQRARAAYIASICQPEATFDLSVAAQHQRPGKDEVMALNKRIRWQIKHLDRGLAYIPLDMATAKLYVFVDGSFANNKDFSSQLGYIIVLANEAIGKDEFTIHGNIVHWSSTKSKRVTRSVLASEILAMVQGVDMGVAIGTTLQKITEKLKVPTIPIVICTDSYSLYECLVKLGSTTEKRLMIDIMHLRQSYERRELYEIRWINGNDNPADAMTKSNPNKALETFVDSNSLQIRVEGWVRRGQQHA
jgi:hypothetical protein